MQDHHEGIARAAEEGRRWEEVKEMVQLLPKTRATLRRREGHTHVFVSQINVVTYALVRVTTSL